MINSDLCLAFDFHLQVMSPDHKGFKCGFTIPDFRVLTTGETKLGGSYGSCKLLVQQQSFLNVSESKFNKTNDNKYVLTFNRKLITNAIL